MGVEITIWHLRLYASDCISEENRSRNERNHYGNGEKLHNEEIKKHCRNE